MIIECLILSLIVGKIRGGKFSNLQKIDINKWYIFILAFIIEFSAILAYYNEIAIIKEYFFYLHLATYILLGIGFLFNVKDLRMDLIFLGTLLNGGVSFLNSGKIPVSLEAINLADLSGYAIKLLNSQHPTHQILNYNMRAWYLGNIIPLIPPYPLAKVISIGDILIAIGLFLVIQKNMKRRTTIFA